MKIKCDYCGNTYEEFQERCPFCSAPNPSHHEGDDQPRTIEELKKWYKDRNLPPENITRFYIGVDYKYPKAFGIFKDENGEFVVYKNKADGTRSIRYKGHDEAYAVDEIFQKLKDEIVHQKCVNAQRRDPSYSPSSPWDFSDSPSGAHHSSSSYSSSSSYDSSNSGYTDEGKAFSRIITIMVSILTACVVLSCCSGGYSGGGSSSGSTGGSNTGYISGYHSTYRNYNDNSWSNNDYDWDSSDSWDYDSTDWDSDW